MAGNPPHPRSGNRNTASTIMTDVDDVYQYLTFINGNGEGYVYKRHIATGLQTGIKMSTLPGNPLGFPMTASQQLDDHFDLSLGIDADGILHVAGNNHDSDNNTVGTHHYVTIDTSLDITVAANWVFAGANDQLGADRNSFIKTADTANATSGPNAGQVYAYNHFFRDSNETLYWAMSQMDDPSSDKGRDWLMFKRVGGQWVSLVGDYSDRTKWGQILISQTILDTDPLWGKEANRIYFCGFHCEERPGQCDRIWAWGIWRTHGGDANFQHQPWVLYSDDAAICAEGASTWKCIDGTPMPMPFIYANRQPAQVEYYDTYAGSSPTIYCTWNVGMILDDNGYPQFTMQEGLLSDPNNHQVIWSYNGSTWSKADAPIQGQFTHIFRFRGYRHFRYRDGFSGGGARVAIATEWYPFQKFQIGPRVTGFYPHPDQVRLRRHGIYSIVIGDEVAPRVWEVGAGARALVV